MRALRSRLLSLVLTLVVGLGLATSALAHRMPTAAEMQAQALQSLGLPAGSICGDQDPAKRHAPCADETCGLCAASAAAALPVASALTLPPLRAMARITWASPAKAAGIAFAFGPPSRAPPGGL